MRRYRIGSYRPTAECWEERCRPMMNIPFSYGSGRRGGPNDPDGAPWSNAAHRTNRTCQGADRIWGRLLRPPLNYPRFPEFGIDVEADLAQIGMINMKKEVASTVYKARTGGRCSFRYQVRNDGRESKPDCFGREYSEARYRYRRGPTKLRGEMKQIGR